MVLGLAGWAGDPAIIQLTPEAAADVVALEAAIEPSLTGDGELAALADWGAKKVGAVLRIRGLLHLGHHGPEGVKVPVERETLLAAIAIGDYCKDQAIRAFTTMWMDAATSDALYLLRRIGRRLDATEISRRDVHFLCRAKFRTAAELEPPLQRLIDHGLLHPAA